MGLLASRRLALSYQDDELLDHEGPPAGQPDIPRVCRLHYRAPPKAAAQEARVFSARLWQVIVLYHGEGRTRMAKLNGMPGSYAANEGISQSIAAAIRG